jgi:2,5-diketo-D-gluconate reductase A
MERCRERRLARSIGISNFSASDLAAVLTAGTIPPVVNQVQFSPVYYRRALLDACRQQDVLIEAYSSLGTGRLLTNPVVQQVAQRAGRTPAQVLLRWCLQHDLLVIPKSVHQERIRENAQLFDFTLSPADMAELDALDRTKGTDQARERRIWRGALRRARAIMPIRRTS